MKLITGNDLKSGDVIWWAGGQNWSRHLADAKDAGDTAESVLASETAAQRVNAGYVVDAINSHGKARPTHIKERIRAIGPTVRLDLAVGDEERNMINYLT